MAFDPDPIRCVTVLAVALAAGCTADIIDHRSPSTDPSICTLTVSPRGDDNNVGTENPLRTVRRAAQLAKAGDVVCVRDGVYAENIAMNASGVEGKPIVLRNYPGERPVMEPDGEKIQRLEIIGVPHPRPISWIEIRGLEIRRGAPCIKLTNAHHITISGNRFVSCTRGLQTVSSHHLVIDGNVIALNETEKEGSGLTVVGSNIRITNNVIHSNRGYGIMVSAPEFNATSHVSEEFVSSANIVLSNNTIVDNRQSGILIWQPNARDVLIQNNVISGNAANVADRPQAVRMFSSGSGHIIRNNLWPDSAPRPALLAEGSGPPATFTETGNLMQAPQLADGVGELYRLAEGSPAIDRGIADQAPLRDFDGRVRPQGRGVDIGAFERQ